MRGAEARRVKAKDAGGVQPPKDTAKEIKTNKRLSRVKAVKAAKVEMSKNSSSSSAALVCWGCGHPGHGRHVCPNKDVKGFKRHPEKQLKPLAL
jgi:hypothetical protein